MTERKETLTIPELLKRLNMAEFDIICPTCRNENYYEVYNGCLQLVCSKDCSEPSVEILSINDLFPTDECEMCGHDKKDHTENLGGGCIWEMIWDNNLKAYVPKDNERTCECEEFKPRLRTVKGIKLTSSPCEATSRSNRCGDLPAERCECGHDEKKHKNYYDLPSPCLEHTDNFETGTTEDEFCPCKQYKPVQMVELVFE